MAIDPYVDMDDMGFNTFLQATLEILGCYLNWSENDFERFFAKANISKRQLRTHLQFISRVSQAINDQVQDLDEDEYVMISLEELARLKAK